MAILYLHRSVETQEVFYVGIGKSINRAYSKHKRSKFWSFYTEKHQYEIEIISDDLTWDEACQREKELINFYGRKIFNTGTLVNIADGGNGGATTTGRKNNSLSEYNKSRKGKPGIKLRWLNKDGKNKRAREEDVPNLLEQGWILGSIRTHEWKKYEGEPWNKGKTYSSSAISKALKGKKRVNYTYTFVECPYCKRSISLNVAKRWHYEKCKHKDNNEKLS